jgi:hypothetical protein
MRNLLLCAALLSSPSARADDQKAILKACKTQAQLNSTATVKADWETTLRYTHPKLIERLGGRGAMLKYLREQMSTVNFKLISLTVSGPTKVSRFGNQLWAVVPQKGVFKVDRDTFEQATYMVGISENAGKDWWFLDGLGIQQLGLTPPPDFKFPKTTPPVKK